jgi:hypothetical protein
MSKAIAAAAAKPIMPCDFVSAPGTYHMLLLRRSVCLNPILALLAKPPKVAFWPKVTLWAEPPPDIPSPLAKGEKAEDEGLQKNSILNVF